MSLLAKTLCVSTLALASIGALVLVATSGARQAAAAPAAKPALAGLADAPITASQARLLELAFESAALLPTNPHVKNRALFQQRVVETALELDQPLRAFAWAERMDTWRQGQAFAELAFHAAEHGAAPAAQQLVQRADVVARDVVHAATEEGTAQGWQSERIRARNAETTAKLADAAGAAGAAGAATLDASRFDAALAAIDQTLATGTFDQAKKALDECAELFASSYADPERRALAEERIRSGMQKLPVQMGLELRMTLARAALDHADAAKALAIVDEAATALASVAWAPEDEIELGARLAALRHRAGDAENARARADALRALFDAKRKAIVDIDRARPLRALAEAYGTMGAAEATRATYALALEEGAHNPNGRPRVDDLGATCCSMARQGFEPDAELWERLEAVRKGLVAPW